MAHTALQQEDLEEFFDDEATVDQRVKEFAHLLTRHHGDLVVYTGAGISTSCGISDFRGPNGIWTRQKRIQEGQAVEVPERVIQSTMTTPSPTHMALVALQEAGYLHRLISTNCDGLHLQSGIRPDKIVELHGNCFVEACPECGATFFRAHPVDLEGFDRSRAILTGRQCEHCQAWLRRTDVAFGQSLPDVALKCAMSHASQAPLSLVLGTSLRVQPACDLPFRKRRASTCIVNLQKTPYDRKASIRVFTPTDVFMSKLCAVLELPLPAYEPQDWTKNEGWMQMFRSTYVFRSAPDETWFDRRDDDMALRFLQEQKRGIGIRMVTDESGDVQMERYALEDDTEGDADMDGFEIYPKKDCPHVRALPGSGLAQQPLDEDRYERGCQVCQESEENWLCLSCSHLLCGRMKQQHMMLHATEHMGRGKEQEQAQHVVCASLADLSFWCYACDSYVTSPLLTPIFNSLHRLKFGENALPIHDIM